MKHAIWFFFHRIYVILKVLYGAGKLIGQLKSEIAYVEVRAVTKKQLDAYEDAQGREATPEDSEHIPHIVTDAGNTLH